MKQRILAFLRKPDLFEVWTALFLALYLLFPGFRGYADISGAKTKLFYLLVGLLGLLALAFFVRDLRDRKYRPLTAAQIAALAFLGFSVLSAALSPIKTGNPWYSSASREGAVTLALYVFLFLAVSRRGRTTERLYGVLFWSLLPFCLLCLVQLLGKNPLWLYPQGMNYGDGWGVRYKGAYVGTIGNVDLVSAFLALVIPVLILHALGKRPGKALPDLLLAALCLAVLFWIRVLCGPVGLLLGGAVCLIVLCPDRTRRWVALSLAAAALTALAVLWFFDLPVGLLHELHELLHGRWEDSFGTGRFYIWRQILSRIPERLWLGVGPDLTRCAGLTPFYRLSETGALLDTAAITDAHCYPLQVLFCQGLPALLSWLCLVGVNLTHWIRARRDPAVSALGAGLVCFLCAMLFCISSIIVMPFCWLTMGLLEARYAQLYPLSLRARDRQTQEAPGEDKIAESAGIQK